MKKLLDKIKAIDKKTMCRTILQIVAYANQIVSLLWQTAPWYQWVSFGFTAVITVVTWWNNNDITAFARLGTLVLDALEDGKITADEVNDLLTKAEEENESHTENTPAGN